MILGWAHARISQLEKRRVNPNKMLIVFVAAVVVVGWVCAAKFFNPLWVAGSFVFLLFAGFKVLVGVLIRSHQEERRLKDEISKFDDHFEAIKFDGEEESKVWDIESRVKHLVYTAQAVLDYQDNLIPAARMDKNVSMEKLVDMYGHYRFLKEHIEEYRAALGNFGDYFNIPTPQALFDTAREGLSEYIQTRRTTDRTISNSRVHPS